MQTEYGTQTRPKRSAHDVQNAGRISFGVKTSQVRIGYEEILRIWREADESEVFEHAWLWDHMLPLRGEVTDAVLEAWTLLAALAAQTTRLRLGVIVTSNRLRPPAVLAKMAATVDQISGGRLVFGLGAGGSAVADPAGASLVQREFGAYGIEVVSPGEAVGALAESVAIVRRLWTETEPFDFEGRFYRLKAAICEPKPVQRPGPPIMLAAAGERSLAIAAEQADMWVWPGDLAGFIEKSTSLDRHCEAIGRDPRTLTRCVQVLVRPGTAAETRDLLVEFVAAGATQLVLGPVPPYPDSAVQWLAEEVCWPVMERLGTRNA